MRDKIKEAKDLLNAALKSGYKFPGGCGKFVAETEMLLTEVMNQKVTTHTSDEQAAERYANENHNWHSCNGISLAPIRRKSFLAGCTHKQSEIDKLKAENAELVEALRNASAYLEITPWQKAHGACNHISTGSTLHNQMRNAIQKHESAGGGS